MADKPVTVRRERIGEAIGRLAEADLARPDRALGLADRATKPHPRHCSHMPVAISHTERLARLVYVVLWVAIIAIVALLARAAVSGALPGQVRVDPRTATPGLAVETDAGTGCQYIVTPWGGIAPRTGADGKQVCSAK